MHTYTYICICMCDLYTIDYIIYINIFIQHDICGKNMIFPYQYFSKFHYGRCKNRASLPAGVSPQRVFSCTRLSLGPQGSRLEVTFFGGGHHETSKVPAGFKLYLFHYYLDVCCGIFVVLRYDLI